MTPVHIQTIDGKDIIITETQKEGISDFSIYENDCDGAYGQSLSLRIDDSNLKKLSAGLNRIRTYETEDNNKVVFDNLLFSYNKENNVCSIGIEGNREYGDEDVGIYLDRSSVISILQAVLLMVKNNE